MPFQPITSAKPASTYTLKPGAVQGGDRIPEPTLTLQQWQRTWGTKQVLGVSGDTVSIFGTLHRQPRCSRRGGRRASIPEPNLCTTAQRIGRVWKRPRRA